MGKTFITIILLTSSEVPKIRIKRAGFDDLETLIFLCRTTFVETFAPSNTTEDIDLYLKKEMNEGKIKAELEDDRSEFYLAEMDAKEVGYMKINYSKSLSDFEDETGAELQRIYLLNSFQQLGIGSKLMAKAISLLKDAGFNYLWLGVWEHNEPALRFYKKLGMFPVGKHTFKLGTDKQTDILMKLDLKD